MKYLFAALTCAMLSVGPTLDGAAQNRPESRRMVAVPLVPATPSPTAGAPLRLEEALTQDGLMSRLSAAMQVLDVPLSDPLSYGHFVPARAHCSDTRSYRSEGGIFLRVHEPTARILSYRDESRLAVLRLSEPAISRDQAIALANRVLNAMGVSAQVSKTHLAEDSSLSGLWRFHLPTGYEGVPCGGGFRVWINGEGRVVHYSDGPSCVQPPSMEQRISQRQANSRASRFVRDRYGRRGVRTGRNSIELAVVHPNNVWHDQSTQLRWEAETTLLCWAVHYPNLQIQGTSRPITIYIDAATGNVVGGIR